MPDIEITRSSIRDWITTIATGEFHYKHVLGINKVFPPREDAKLRKIIYELCQMGVCEPVGRRDGYYRPVQELPQPLDWQSSDGHRDSGLILPFNLRKHVFIYPETTTIVAGSKSSGKTEFLYETVLLNMGRKVVTLLTNLEGGKDMLRDRFYAMNPTLPDPAPFEIYFITDNFQDYIKMKDRIYVIDYIDAPDGDNFYLIGAQIKKIDQKLQGLNSEAVIGLQKPLLRDIAFGGEQTLKNATLYLAIDNKKLKIVDAKVPADKKVHPKNMQWTFDYVEGVRFENIQPFYGSNQF